MARKEVIEKNIARMTQPENIRNFCLIAHVDHGKSTLSDSLVSKAKLIAQSTAGKNRWLDTRIDEQERSITIKSTSVALPFDVPVKQKSAFFNPNWPAPAPPPSDLDEKEPQTTPFLFNLIDCPGHVDFSSEVTTALRVTDGAIVVVDCVEGVCVQTRTVLRQAIQERVKPVLFMNKMDRLFGELQLDPEAAYQSLANTIKSVNTIISTYQDQKLGDHTVWPQAGSVAFGSGLQGWGFTLEDFARIHHNTFNLHPKKMMKKLWGDNFWDPRRKTWVTHQYSESGRRLKRGFVWLVYEPLQELFQAISDADTEKLIKFCHSQHINLSESLEESKLDPVKLKDVAKEILQQWLPAAEPMIAMAVADLPSPVEAQVYRTEILYSGAQDDEVAQSMRQCDAKGELMIYISKQVPSTDKSRFFAFGRVFSGTVHNGQVVRIQGPDYDPDSKQPTDVFEKRVTGVALLMGPHVENVAECPAGNIIALVGVDQYLLKSGTITTFKKAHNFQAMKYSVAPVVSVAVSVVQTAHLNKLTQGLKRLSKSDPLVQVHTSPTGEHVISCCGELHMEVCLKDLQEEFMSGIPLKIGNPVVTFRETIQGNNLQQPCIGKSPNKLNRIVMTAEPLSELVTNAIANHEISLDCRSMGSVQSQERTAWLASEEVGWSPGDCKKIWCFGCPPEGEANVLVDKSRAVPYLSEVKDLVCTGFAECTLEGVIANEPMRGVRFNVEDAKIHADPAHRGVGSIVPCTRRAVYACQIAAVPQLMEPMYQCNILLPSAALPGARATLKARRAVIESTLNIESDLFEVVAFLPVVESFGFSAALGKSTSGQAFPQTSFSHWQRVPGDVYDATSAAAKIAMQIRSRKGLKLELPSLNDFHSKS